MNSFDESACYVVEAQEAFLEAEPGDHIVLEGLEDDLERYTFQVMQVIGNKMWLMPLVIVEVEGSLN